MEPLGRESSAVELDAGSFAVNQAIAVGNRVQPAHVSNCFCLPLQLAGAQQGMRHGMTPINHPSDMVSFFCGTPSQLVHSFNQHMQSRCHSFHTYDPCFLFAGIQNRFIQSLGLVKSVIPLPSPNALAASGEVCRARYPNSPAKEIAAAVHGARCGCNVGPIYEARSFKGRDQNSATARVGFFVSLGLYIVVFFVVVINFIYYYYDHDDGAYCCFWQAALSEPCNCHRI